MQKVEEEGDFMKRLLILTLIFIMMFSVAATTSNQQPITQDVWWVSEPDFVINETSDFDAGVKSNSLGNYEMETFTDNGNITANTLALGNKYGDKFTFPYDGATWKWNHVGNPSGGAGTPKMNISTTVSGVMHVTCSACNDGFINITSHTSGDFDMRINMQQIQHSGLGDIGLRHYINAVNESWIIKENVFGSEYLISRTEIGGSVMQNTTNPYSDDDLSIRMSRIGDNLTQYFDSAGGNSWTLHQDRLKYTDSANIGWLGLRIMSALGGTDEIYFDNYEMINGGLLGTDVYRKSGHWNSTNVTIPAASTLGNVTINLTNADANQGISAVYFYSDGDLVATNETDILVNGAATYSTANGLDTGSFDLLNDTSNLTIQVFMTSDGAGSAVVEDIIGYFFEGTPQITILLPYNNTYCDGGNFWQNVTSTMSLSWCRVSMNGGGNQSMTKDGSIWWDWRSFAPNTYTSVYTCANEDGLENQTNITYTLGSTNTVIKISPANISYCGNNLWLNVTTSLGSSWVYGEIDETTNYTLTNSSLYNWSVRISPAWTCTSNSHNITFYTNSSCLAGTGLPSSEEEQSTLLWFWFCCCDGGNETGIAVALVIIIFTIFYLFIGFHKAGDWFSEAFKLLFLGIGFSFITAFLYILTDMSSLETGLSGMIENFMIIMIGVFTLIFFVSFIFVLRKAIGLWYDEHE